MFPYRQILELHDEDRSLRSIAAMTRHSRQKVTEVIRLAEKRGLKCPLDEEMTDVWIEDFLYPEKKLEASGRQMIDFDYLHEELAKPHVTLTLLHQEYEKKAQEQEKIPYAYRTFTEHYHDFAQKYKATMRIKRKPGEVLEVDWAGSTLFIIDPDTGEKVKVYVFVAALPCSQLSYVEGSLSMDLASWIKLHQHTFEYMGGTTQIIVPDNLKTGVTKHTSKELVLNKTYEEMVRHYHSVVMPARVRSPKDKPSVESSVNTVSTWIIAALRHVQCFTLEEMNQEIQKKLEEFNHRSFTKKEGSRWSAFMEEEKFALTPLPTKPYQMSEWRTGKVQPDYHISVKSMFYSVPYEYIGKHVDVKVSDDAIEVYFNHMRIASHPTLYGKYGQYSTVKDHMPDNHKHYVEQTPQNALDWAAEVGEHTLFVVKFLLDSYGVEKQAMKSIFALKKLERTYTAYEIERACKMVHQITNRPTVKSIQTLIKNNKKTDAEKAFAQQKQTVKNEHAFTRGASYFGGKNK
ncbi:IS21 family transposase [Salicibibacter cibarius]|uniref:IS21 family transposase n=1 Tax=Salicibibacter cibarius TaxID=2743000 RepID=A0A7T6Z6M4_9BACI|nr:IS21 family transposase [Salicibibacter cibarius]QQK77782.1 IS21 family transposase [Salicibibacter cibarius]